MKKGGKFDNVGERNKAIDDLTSNQKVSKAIKIVVADMEQMKEGLKNAERMKDIHGIYKDTQAGDIGAGQRALTGATETLSATYLKPLIPAISGFFTTAAAGLIKASQAGEGNTATKLAVGAGGIVLAGGAAVTKYVIDNPGQATNTVALGALTAAVSTNTAAQLGKGALAEAGAAASTAGRVGLGSAAVAGGTFALGATAAIGAGVGAYMLLDYATESYMRKNPQGKQAQDRLNKLKALETSDAKITGKGESYGPFRTWVPDQGRNAGGKGHFETDAPKYYDPATPGAKFDKGTVARGRGLVAPVVEQQFGPTAGDRDRALREQLARDQNAKKLATPMFGRLPDRSLFAPDAKPGPPLNPAFKAKPEAFKLEGVPPLISGIQAGVSTFKAAADGLPAKGSSFGEQVGAGMAGQAGGIGSAIGAAFAAVAAGVKISVDAPKSAATGSPPAPE